MKVVFNKLALLLILLVLSPASKASPGHSYSFSQLCAASYLLHYANNAAFCRNAYTTRALQQVTRDTHSNINAHIFDNLIPEPLVVSSVLESISVFPSLIPSVKSSLRPSIGPSVDSLDSLSLNDKSNKAAASSDSLGSGINFWGTTSFSEISKDNDSNQAQFDTDIYQFIGGADTRIGDLYLGAALTYAYSEYEVSPTLFANDSSSHTVGITPYAAYKINDFLFASVLAGYTYTNTNFSSSGPLALETDTHEYLTEANINAFKTIDALIFKGRAGVRYKHTNSSAIQSVFNRDNDFDELTWIGDVEVGFRLTESVRVYTGTLYEYVDRETSAASTLVNDGVAFMRYGIEYTVGRDLYVGARFQHDLNDEDNDFATGGVNVRLAM